MFSICPHCNSKNSHNKFVRKYLINGISCSSCNKKYVPEKIKTKNKNINREQSEYHEKKVAKQYRAKTQPGSGAMGHAKADVIREDFYRLECKTTTKKSISLKLEWLQKLTKEAAGSELPILEILFNNTTTKEQYAVIRSQDLRALLEELEELRETKND